jgi:hypothetical protein
VEAAGISAAQAESVELAALEESAALEELAESAALEELAESAVQAESEELAARAELATVLHNCRPEAVDAKTGSTIPNIEVVRPTGTAPLLTGSGAPPGVILLLIARPAPGNSLAGRAATSPATAPAEPG